MQCRAIPYEGNEPYIFLSYCHKDSDLVYPLFTQMVKDGYRVWYDDGNIAGDDWPENIANHLNNCCVCVAFISENSSNSHNCNTEVTFAIKQAKKLLPVMLEEFSLPLGLSMLLSTVHYLQKMDFTTDRALLQKIYQMPELEKCKAEPGSLKLKDIPEENVATSDADVDPVISSLTISLSNDHDEVDAQEEKTEETPVVTPEKTEETPEKTEETGKGVKATAHKVKVTPKKVTLKVTTQETEKDEEITEDATAEDVTSDEVVSEVHTTEEKTPEVIPADTPAEESQEQAEATDDVAAAEEDYYDEKTVIGERTVVEDATIRPQAAKIPSALLLYPDGGQCFQLSSLHTKLGRMASQSDIVIDSKTISRHHADILFSEDEYFLSDNDSLNGTFYNGESVAKGTSVKLENPAVFQLHEETLVLVSGEMAVALREQGYAALLMNAARTFARVIEGSSLELNRNNVWPDKTLNDPKVHRVDHAVVHNRPDGLYLEDVAPENGNRTYLNGSKMSPKETRKLKNGDYIRLGNTTLEVVLIEL